MRQFFWLVYCLYLFCGPLGASLAQDGNRFTHLDQRSNPYYVGREFPKLTTPQWVGEKGVEAVVVLAIDDMRDTAKYENFLRPILKRLKQIDQRAPVSIMTNSVDPDDPQLQSWLAEGLSIECHTIDHPCPLLGGGDFAKAKSTYDRCVDRLAKIPGSRPVAFRVPCCDSRNTPSPRFWSEIFDRYTPNGNFLSINSSVFNITTANDPDLPRELVLDTNGKPRFQKYLPFPSFVNTIKDYPYPYLIGSCWEFPCTVPSDWEAQHLHGKNNPKTVEDLKAALDAVVIKQGVMNLVFHPHGWIRNDQIVELIEHAVSKHGSKVKFLTFKEAHARIRENLLHGNELGNYASDAGIRLLDVNADGFMDVIHGGRMNALGKALDLPTVQIWQPKTSHWDWEERFFPASLVAKLPHNDTELGARFGVLQPNGYASLLIYHKTGTVNEPHPDSGIWHFDGAVWNRDDAGFWQSMFKDATPIIPEHCEGVRLRNLNEDGICELIVAPAETRGRFNLKSKGQRGVYRLDQENHQWRRLPFELPANVAITAPKTKRGPNFPDGGLRFVDVNKDGFDDIIFSNDQRYSLHLWKNMKQGWSEEIIQAVRDQGGDPVIPKIVRSDGTNNGVWFHSDHMWVQNEDTSQMADGVDRLSFKNMMAGTIPVGAAKIDITPDYPVRLSGYGNRRSESDGVAQKIWAKAVAIGSDDDQPAVLITVENCGMTPSIRSAVVKRLLDANKIPNERVVISVSHTHSAPCLTDWAPYLFSQDIPEPHQKNIDRYTGELTDNLVAVAQQALASRRPGQLFWTSGKVGFAANRRVVQSGAWSGFGVQNGGPVDHSLPMLAAKDATGKLIAVIANYACHCTTMGGDFNKIAGDWAGYAQEFVEADNPGAIALITIGCGADANPNPRGSLDLSRKHGRALADEINQLLTTKLSPILNQPQCKLEFVDLPFSKLPTTKQWEELAKQPGTRGYHAKQFLKKINTGEKIPQSIPYPVATWTFGKDLAMVFLGGEVVVDYAIRLKQEFDGKRIWISAYCNDVPCYIASKRVLREGGYEADSSMLYYARPARWSEQVEDTIVDKVQELLPREFYSEKKQLDFPPPKTPQQSLSTITTSDSQNLIVELVAAEPLVVDPVAFDWGPNGRLWVVEMRDYPNGLDWNGTTDPIGKPGGRVKVLDDDDGDGVYDRATVFLDEIPFPTGIKVWRDGILVTAAPEIFFAKDTNGDDVADHKESLYRGFGEGNQQHRVNGLRWGLDNWLYVGNGDSGGSIKSLKTGTVVNVSGRDLRIEPDSGRIEARSGQTQFGICRDDWGNWFGGNNSNPMWHYVLEDQYLKRNPHLAPPPVQRHVSTQPGAAPVFPTSRTLARFNDFNRANRFTSACSPIVYRDQLIGDPELTYTFVCEPVHNLVHREQLTATGSTFTSRRVQSETESEFLRSTDNWFRPTMVRTGPDGALWIADMYRFVIEHPKWIPESWQQKLDLRAGDTMGRIYRVRPANQPAKPIPRLGQLTTVQLAEQLTSENGWIRDMAQQMMVWRKDKRSVETIGKLLDLIQHGDDPRSRMHALCTLDGLGETKQVLIIAALYDEHPAVRRHAVRIGESNLKSSIFFAEKIGRLVDDPDPFVRMQVAYCLGELEHESAGKHLVRLAKQNSDDPNLNAAVLSSIHAKNLDTVVAAIADIQTRPPEKFCKKVLLLTASIGNEQFINHLVSSLLKPSSGQYSSWQFAALQGLIDVMRKKGLKPSECFTPESKAQISAMFEVASKMATDSRVAESDRVASIKLLGTSFVAGKESDRRLLNLLSPKHPTLIQSAAVSAIAQQSRKESATTLLTNWRSYSPQIRSQVVDALLSRLSWTKQLVSAMEQGRVLAAHFDATRRQKLLNHPEPSIQDRAKVLFAVSSTADRQSVLDQYQESISLTGDRAQGKTHFEKHCSACHRLEQVGHAVGPDLLALTDKSSRSLLVAMLDPNRAVEDKFLSYVATTEDGQLLAGMITNETSVSLTLTANDGKPHTILRSNLEGFRSSGKSLMPEGIEQDLSPQQIANVIAYVQGFAMPHKSFPSNEPATVMAEADGTIRLPATRARIYGPSLIFEQHFKNLGYWHSTDDRAIWQFVVPEANSYHVRFDYACHADVAGQRFKLNVAGKSLSGVVESTGTWDKYQTLDVGTLELPAGPVELIMHSDGIINQAMIDLKSIELTPTKQ